MVSVCKASRGRLRRSGRRGGAGGLEGLATGNLSFAFLALAFLNGWRSSGKSAQKRALLLVGYKYLELLFTLCSDELLLLVGRLVRDAELLEQLLQVSSLCGRVRSRRPADNSSRMGDSLACSSSGGGGAAAAAARGGVLEPTVFEAE